MGVPNKSNEEANRQTAGYNGTRYISGTSAVPCKAIGYEAWTDTVFNTVKNSAGTDMVATMGLTGITIPEGKVFWFGFECSEIDLTSGTGVYILAE